MYFYDIAKLFIFLFAFWICIVVAFLNSLTTFLSRDGEILRNLITRIAKLFNCFSNITNRRGLNRRSEFSEEIRRGDSFIDKLLERILELRYLYDPYYLEDIQTEFNRNFVVNVNGEIKLSQGYFTGLRTLRRGAHCSLHGSNGRLYIKAYIGIGSLYFQHRAILKIMNSLLVIFMHGTISYMEVLMELSFDSTTGRDGRLNKFTVVDKRGIKVWVAGLGPLNWIVNLVVRAGIRYYIGFVKNNVEKKIVEHLSNFQFLVEDIENRGLKAASNTTAETQNLDLAGKAITEKSKETEQQITDKYIVVESEELIVGETVEHRVEEPTEPVAAPNLRADVPSEPVAAPDKRAEVPRNPDAAYDARPQEPSEPVAASDERAEEPVAASDERAEEPSEPEPASDVRAYGPSEPESASATFDERAEETSEPESASDVRAEGPSEPEAASEVRAEEPKRASAAVDSDDIHIKKRRRRRGRNTKMMTSS